MAWRGVVVGALGSQSEKCLPNPVAKRFPGVEHSVEGDPRGFPAEAFPCGGERELLGAEGEHVRIHGPEVRRDPIRSFEVRNERVEVRAQNEHEVRRLRHARALDEPLAEIDGLSAVDPGARLVERFVDDGLLGDFAVVAVASGEAFPSNSRWDCSDDEIRYAVLVNENRTCCRLGLDPSTVRRVGVAAGVLVPVVRLQPLAEWGVALVAPLGNEVVGDGCAAFSLGHISPKGPRMLDYSVTFCNLRTSSFWLFSAYFVTNSLNVP